MKKNKTNWFVDTFLKSFEEKFEATVGTKYKGQLIITAKQAEVCYRNMDFETCGSVYEGEFTFWHFDLVEDTPRDKYSYFHKKTVYSCNHRGKYYFLNKDICEDIIYHTCPPDEYFVEVK